MSCPLALVVALMFGLCCAPASPDGAGSGSGEGSGSGSHAHAKGHVRKPLPGADVIAKLPPDGGPEFNRLIFEKSPYLRQHARNKVDWWPWGKAAFAKAKKEGKIVFLSIGYSTCHWCHVMEHECFEKDGPIAKLMNERFVAVKVDREERPDVDQVYMAALHRLGRRGGWPLSMFMTPDGKPFFGGTYWPPKDQGRHPGFLSILKLVDKFWREKKDDILSDADKLSKLVADGFRERGKAVKLGQKTLERAYAQLAHRFDDQHAGFGRPPKFPQPQNLLFLLRRYHRTGAKPALSMVEMTLDRMARGGLVDHLGGGFHRYSTDREWLLPHFEKMLYDQAMIARAYLEAYAVTGHARHAAVARDVFTYVLRDMTDPAGGFYSAEDADSEGVEGKFYVWTTKELRALLGEDASLFIDVYGAIDDGNFLEEATKRKTGENILHLRAPLSVTAKRLGMTTEALSAKLATLRTRLWTEREKRVHPGKDDKILADWNGLMIASMAYGGRLLGEAKYIEAATNAATFVTTRMRRADGRLLHRYRDGEAAIPGFLIDHAYLTYGLLELYRATLDPRWLAEAKRTADAMIALFWEKEQSAFATTGTDQEKLLVRAVTMAGGARPAANEVAVDALLRLTKLTMDKRYAEYARKTLERFSEDIEQFPHAYPYTMLALDFEQGSQEIVLAGRPGSPALKALRAVIDRRYLPNAVVALHPVGDAVRAKATFALMPFVMKQGMVDGQATAYVCEDYTCQAPVTTPEALTRLLSLPARGK